MNAFPLLHLKIKIKDEILYSTIHSLKITLVMYFLMVAISKPMEMVLEEASNLIMKCVWHGKK